MNMMRKKERHTLMRDRVGVLMAGPPSREWAAHDTKRERERERERVRERERDTHIPSTLHVTATLRQELVIYPGLRVGGYTQTWDQGPPASQLVCQSPTERNSLRDCGFCC